MKNGLLIWNIILTLGLGYLLIQSFSQGSEQPAAETTEAVDGDAPESLVIRYVHADSILENFSEFREQQEALTAKEEAENQRLNKMMQTLEQDFMAVQQKIQKGMLTPKQIQQEEQRFAQEQQRMQAEQERVSRQLLQESQALQERLMGKLQRVLKEVKNEKGYDLVLSYGPGTGVLMADEDLDITEDVLAGLNRPDEEE